MPNPNIQALKQDEFTTASVFNLPPPAIQTTLPSIIEDDFTKLPEMTTAAAPLEELDDFTTKSPFDFRDGSECPGSPGSPGKKWLKSSIFGLK